MVLREAVAERVVGLKKRLPIEAPIVQELPVPARRVSSALITLPEVEGVIPVIVRGKAYGETAGVWYRVTFPRVLKDPSVVPVGEGRLGIIPTPKAPTISITPVSVAPVAIGVASAKVPAAARIVVRKAVTGYVPTSLGRFECGWAIASLTDGLNDLVETLESVFARVNTIIDDLTLGYEEIRSSFLSLDKKVDDLRAKVNEALESYRVNDQAATNLGLSNLRTSTRDSLETLRRNTEGAVNMGLAAVLPALYDAWGVPKNMALTPLHVRNVTSTGFEFQSYGKTTCYYIAVGSLL